MSAGALRTRVSKKKIPESNPNGARRVTKGTKGTQKEAERETKMEVETTIST